jgi:hypothetical protein
MKEQILLNALIMAISFFLIHQLRGQTFTNPQLTVCPLPVWIRKRLVNQEDPASCEGQMKTGIRLEAVEYKGIICYIQ